MVIHYVKIWWFLTLATTQLSFQSRFGAILFMLGKILRFTFFFFFLVILVTQTKAIAGYSLWQVILFYATFNLMDTLPQFFFRNVYRFRQQVVSGYFDNLLTKPLPALFHPLFGGSDMMDLIILIASPVFIIIAAMHIPGITVTHIFSYLLLLANGFLIATAFHIFVLGIGILTTAVDNTIMLYRDLTQMGRVPIEVYQEPLRGLITFVIPVGLMMTFPTQAMLGLLSWQSIGLTLLVGISLLLASLKFWQYSLRGYTSASS
jgi:ABC-2 type transport system permease protein